jgi:uncharacterized protein Yka (UPF0111/DUF47 family)
MGITPKDTVLFDLYSSLADRLAAGARAAAELVASEMEQRKGIAKRIGEIETEADQLLGKIIRRIDEMFVTPYDRGDLQDLANVLDDAMDCIEEATDIAVLHGVEEFPTQTTDLVDAVRRLAELTSSSMPRIEYIGALLRRSSVVNMMRCRYFELLESSTSWKMLSTRWRKSLEPFVLSS